jgi:hypothetical protein
MLNSQMQALDFFKIAQQNLTVKISGTGIPRSTASAKLIVET